VSGCTDTRPEIELISAGPEVSGIVSGDVTGVAAPPPSPGFSMSIKISSELKKTINRLHKLGIVNYTAGDELNKGHILNAQKQAIKFAHILAVKSDFAVREVSKSQAKDLRDSGFFVNKHGKAFIPKRDADRVTLRGDKLTYKGKDRNGNPIKKVTTLASSMGFLGKLEKLSKQPLKPNQFITVQIGDNNAFNRRFQTHAELIQYLKEDFQPKRGMSKSQLIRIMSIVEIEATPYVKPKKAPKNKRGK